MPISIDLMPLAVLFLGVAASLYPCCLFASKVVLELWWLVATMLYCNQNKRQPEPSLNSELATHGLETEGCSHTHTQSTPNMTGQRFHRTAEVIPRRPWKSKSPFASRPIRTSRNKGQGVRTRYDAAAVLLPFISIVRSPGRPVLPAPDTLTHTHTSSCCRAVSNVHGVPFTGMQVLR